MAARGCVSALLQLCVERLDYLVFFLELLTQPACTHNRTHVEIELAALSITITIDTDDSMPAKYYCHLTVGLDFIGK